MISLLYIEDSKESRDAVRAILAAVDPPISIHFSTTYHDAMRALANRHYDIILLDLLLGDNPDAETLVRQVCDVGRAPVIVLTGIANEQDELAKQCLLAGATEFFSKQHISHVAKIDRDPGLLPRVIRKVYYAEQGRKAAARRAGA